MNGNARVRLSPPRGSPLPEPVTLCNGSGTALGVTKVVRGALFVEERSKPPLASSNPLQMCWGRASPQRKYLFSRRAPSVKTAGTSYPDEHKP